jgi:hypothetical protein
LGAIKLALFFEVKMLKIILIAIAGVAITVGAVNYINDTDRQSLEEKYIYLQRDVKQLTKEVSALKNTIEAQVSANSKQQGVALHSTLKNSRVSPDMYHDNLTSAKTSKTMLEHQNRANQERIRKKNLGTSMAIN